MPNTPGNWQICRHATPDHSPQFGIYSDEGSPTDFVIVKGEHAAEDVAVMASSKKLLAALAATAECLEEHRQNGYMTGWDLALMRAEVAIADATTLPPPQPT